eukprot:s1118_g12.t2
MNILQMQPGLISNSQSQISKAQVENPCELGQVASYGMLWVAFDRLKKLERSFWDFMSSGWPIFGLLSRLSEVISLSGQARPVDALCGRDATQTQHLSGLRLDFFQRLSERRSVPDALARKVVAAVERLESREQRQLSLGSPGLRKLRATHRKMRQPAAIVWLKVGTAHHRFVHLQSFRFSYWGPKSHIWARKRHGLWAMVKLWPCWLLAMTAEAATHALHLSANGEIWDFPMEPGKRMVRHETRGHQPSAYLQQDRQDPDAVKILSNNTGRIEDFLRTLKQEAAEANLGIALGLTGPLLCVMALFYMVNQSLNQDLVMCTWQLLSGNIALFATVLTFMALKKAWKLLVGGQAEQMALIGDILAFLKFIVLLIGIPLLRSKLETSTAAARWLPALRTTGAYLIGFAGADCFANFLRLEPFSNGAGFYFLGMLLVLGVLAALLALAWRISQYGRPSDAPYEPEREAEQVDAAGFQIGFLMSMWLRFLVTGFLPGSKKEAHPLSSQDLAYLGGALLISMAIFALMMWKVRALADSTERKPIYRRIYRILTESSGMTMAWLLMYWVQWIFWYFHQNADGSHRSGRHAALMSVCWHQKRKNVDEFGELLPKWNGTIGDRAASLSVMAFTLRRVATRAVSDSAPVLAAARRAKRRLDAAAVGVLGALLLYANNGQETAEGWLLGAVFAVLYLILLQQDVSVITVESNPFNLTNPFRILRFLLPFGLVAALGLQHALTVGLDEWWQNVSWPGDLAAWDQLPRRRRRVVAAGRPAGLRRDVRGAAAAGPGRDAPGGTAAGEGGARVAGSLGMPEWVATKPCSGIGSSRQRLVSQSDFQALEQTRSLAVSYRPAGDDLEEVEVTSDMEWALTNGLDFTVLNDSETTQALEEVMKASQAIVSTALVYAGLMALVFLAKRMGKKVSDFTELCNAFVLQTGFCWEMAIYVGLVDSTTKLSNPNSRSFCRPQTSDSEENCSHCLDLLLAGDDHPCVVLVYPSQSAESGGRQG